MGEWKALGPLSFSPRRKNEFRSKFYFGALDEFPPWL